MSHPNPDDFLQGWTPGDRRRAYVRRDKIVAVMETGNASRGETARCAVYLDPQLAIDIDDSIERVMAKITAPAEEAE